MASTKNTFSKKTIKEIDKAFTETKQVFEDNPKITTQFINAKGTYDSKSIEKASKAQEYNKKQGGTWKKSCES